MINLESQFTPRINPADTNYPFGSLKDNTSPGANDGTPLAAVWGNDFEGFRQAAMTEAGLTPSGLPDTAQDSQLLAAVKAVTVGQLAETTGATEIGTDDGSTVQQRLTRLDQVVAAPNDYPTAAQLAKKITDGTLPTISCYGDSTMWGATVGKLGVQSANNPPAKLSQALTLIYGQSFTVNNRAISGTTLRGMLAGTDGSGSTFASKIATGGVDAGANIIYCNHCINDSQLNLGIDQYRADLVEFIRLCRDAGKVPILVTPNPNPPLQIIDQTKSKRLDHYVRTMRDVAAANGVDLVDNYNYFNLTARRIPIDTIVPDGAHLSDRGYTQSGYNLAIPLVCAPVLDKVGDYAGITNVSYYTNSTTMVVLDHDGKTGPILSMTREATTTGINYPFIALESVRQLSIVGLQWSDAANGFVSFNNDGTSKTYYPQKQFGNDASLMWDADNIINADVWCGLNIVGILFDIATPGLGSGLTFAGVGLPKVSASFGVDATVPRRECVIHSYSRFIGQVKFSASDSISLVDNAGSQVIGIDKSAGNPVLKLYKNGSVAQSVDLSPSALTDGVYGVMISITNTTVTANLAGLGASITIATPLPELRVATPYQMCNVYNPY